MKLTKPGTGIYEPILAQVVQTANGYPADLDTVRSIYGVAMRSDREGWFWIFATPLSAERIRKNGHHVRGSETSTFIPPEEVAR